MTQYVLVIPHHHLVIGPFESEDAAYAFKVKSVYYGQDVFIRALKPPSMRMIKVKSHTGKRAGL